MVEIREAPVPVRWRWYGTNEWMEGGEPWFLNRGKDDWNAFICMPLTVELSNGQTVIVRAKK